MFAFKEKPAIAKQYNHRPISNYETKRLITHTLKEFDIDVDRHEADRSLIIRDANEIILRPTLDSLLQYLKTLERLAIKCGRSGIDVIVDVGSFRHIRIKQELVEYENRLNIICGASKCSILCCHHNKDVKALGGNTIEEIHKSHLKNYVVKEQE